MNSGGIRPVSVPALGEREGVQKGTHLDSQEAIPASRQPDTQTPCRTLLSGRRRLVNGKTKVTYMTFLTYNNSKRTQNPRGQASSAAPRRPSCRGRRREGGHRHVRAADAWVGWCGRHSGGAGEVTGATPTCLLRSHHPEFAEPPTVLKQE